MTDNMDEILAGLDRPSEPTEVKPTKAPRKRRGPREAATKSASASKSERAKREAGTSVQRGPRADPLYTQVNANVRRSLKASLFYYLKEENRTLSEVVEELLERWVDERGGEFIPRPTKESK